MDWLEFVAFFSEFRVARLDELDAAIGEQFELTEDKNSGESDNFSDIADGDIASIDAEKERIRERIENEVQFRIRDCEGAYPFTLGDFAEELTLAENWQDDRFTPYLTCLVTSHLTRSALFDFTVSDNLVRRLRNRVFQVISTFAMAGLASGSAASIGWPRTDRADIIKTLKRAEARGAGFLTRNTPGKYASPQDKDGGVDIIAWQVDTRLPPILFYFAQVASGHNWPGKTVKELSKIFEVNYLDDPHRGNRNFATLLPFRIADEQVWISEHMMHGVLLDRTRLPRHAVLGQNIAAKGLEMDESENMHQVLDWLNEFRAEALP